MCRTQFICFIIVLLYKTILVLDFVSLLFINFIIIITKDNFKHSQKFY